MAALAQKASTILKTLISGEEIEVEVVEGCRKVCALGDDYDYV